MHLSALFVYPLKSGRGIPLAEARVEERGFHGDRRFMAVGPDGAFLSQRTHPRLGLPSVELDASTLRLSHPGQRPLDIALHDTSRRRVDVTVWGDAVRAFSCGDAAADWLTELLGGPAELVHMPQDSERTLDPDGPCGPVAVSFADAYPYLLTNDASLGDLNARISGPPVPMQAFRPNMVVEGAEAWAEDGWEELRIGGARFRAAAPCERCTITTLDPDSPERRRPDQEPLRTLASFRRGEGAGVLFGIHLVCLTPGAIVRVGDPFRVS